MRRAVLTLFVLALVWTPLLAAERVPGEQWMRYVDPADAGFDAARLAEAEAAWEELPSSAFMVIADGAVVAAWGDVERRFMCHSVRKSFLSAIYGIYWDRGEIELNRTMAEIGIEEPDDPLLPRETQARTLDLLKARSGVFHPAAYAGRTDSRPRGSEGPGQFFGYNNWDFNTLAAILKLETGADVFESWDEHFAGPLDMQDWRLTDGYYHYERDKSQYPAYPFRLSARDAARFGLLFAREGMWGDQRVLSRNWVRRSTALYSIDDEVFGYGFMWWVAREPRFLKYGFYTASGVGNQKIAVIPELDLVIVNRANTYAGVRTPQGPLLDLMEKVIEARVGEPVPDPALTPLESGESPGIRTRVPDEKLDEMAGSWDYPPAELGLPVETTVDISVEDGHLVTFSEVSGTFEHYLQEDGWLVEEDSYERYRPIRDDDGAFVGIAGPSVIADAALLAAGRGDKKTTKRRMALLEGEDGFSASIARVLVDEIQGRKNVDADARALLESFNPRGVGWQINGVGYLLMGAELLEPAERVFLLNTRLFPEVGNPWDSLGECQAALGKIEPAIASYQKALELDPENPRAEEIIDRLKAQLP